MEHRIKEIIKDKGITVVALSEKVGITQPNMSNIINGKINPSIETLEKIAIALEVSMSSLFEVESALYGLVTFKGKTYKLDNDQSLQAFLKDYSAL